MRWTWGPWLWCSVMVLAATARAQAQATLTADAHVNAALPTANSGTLSNIAVGNGYTGLLQFDLSLLPAGTTPARISRAVLRLYVNHLDTAGLVSLQPLAGDWSEYGVTSQTLPGLGSAVQVFPVTQAGAFVAVDVTGLVQGWVTAPATNHGIALTAGTAALQFDSKENDLTAHAADLVIDLAAQGATGAIGPAGATGPSGPQGPAGLPGPAGVAGPTGAQGSRGVVGPAGVAGPAGARGTSGFTYQGTYSSTTNYAVSDVVLFNGSSYIGLLAANHGNTPDASPAFWGVVAVGASGTVTGGGGGSPATASTYQGAYNSSSNYAQGDIVLFAGSSYLSLMAGNHGNTPQINGSTYWGLLAFGGQGVGPQGPKGDTGSPGAQGVPGFGYEGTYSPVTNYGLNDVVSFGGSSYISLFAGNHGNTPGQVLQAWSVLAAAGVGSVGPQGPVGVPGPQGAPGLAGPTGAGGLQGVAGPAGARGLPGLVYQGTYASSTNYALGDVVLWQGASWASLVEGNHGNTPDASPASWGMLTQRGPAGAIGMTGGQGPAGVPGALGPVGPPGERGDQGLQGIAGQAGAQGIPGIKGDTGLSGPAGPQGSAGPAGLAFQGAYRSDANYALADGVVYGGASYVSLVAGNHGNTPDLSPAAWSLFAAAGATGASGPAGPAGLPGPAGPQGIQGASGSSGAAGAIGPQGPPAIHYSANYAATTNYAVADAVAYGGSTYISLVNGNHGNTPDASPAYWAMLVAKGDVGASGPAGPQGSPGVAGPGGAAGAQGLQGPPVNFLGGWSVNPGYIAGDAVSYAGSSYIALTANTGRQPDISPTYWGLLAQIGRAGPAGTQGAQGLQGPTGYPGPTGAMGAQGVQGSIGPVGPAGPTGSMGATGAAGAKGDAGLTGLTYRGTYNSSTNYAINDGVLFGGSTYISLTASNSGNTPDASPQFWALLAMQGAAGAAGNAGQNGLNGAAGPQGQTGSQGPIGVTGAAGTNGTAGLVYQGTYDSAHNYALNDAVTYLGASYLSLLAANHGNVPDTSTSAWATLAQRGSPGVAGMQGATGPAGPAGPAGPTGTQGQQGNAGSPGINFRGAWVSAAGYTLGDAVTYAGATYYAESASHGVTPGSDGGSTWALLAAAGSTGPTGAAGTPAMVLAGTTTTGSAGSNAQVSSRVNNGTTYFDFVVPQGAAGTGGGGAGSGTSNTSGIPFAAMYHAVSFSNNYYSTNNTNQSPNEGASVLTWVPGGCTATKLVVYSQQAATITVTLRVGMPGAMVDSALTCQVATGQSCTAAGSVAVTAGGFVDIGITHPDSNAAGVWTAIACN